MTISSPHNPRLKHLRQLANRRRERERTGHFVAEGEDLLAAADAAGWEPVERFVAAGSGLEGLEVEPELLDRASQLGSGTRALAVYEARWGKPVGPRCVYLHGVSDPGNVGTVLRSAVAFGAGSVALGPGCADPYGPKAVRASMGAIFAVRVARVAGVDAVPGPRVALVAGVGDPVATLDGGASLIVGAEREGLPPEVLAACEHVAHIPMAPGADSLNAAMAATVALYVSSTSGSTIGPA
jgi:TrmH family RNA methyltransferase